MISQRFLTVGLRSANSFSCLGDFPPRSRDLDKLHARRIYIQHKSYILKSGLKAKSDMSPKLSLNILSMAANHWFLVMHPRNWFVCIRSPAVWKIRISKRPTHSSLPSCSSYRGRLGTDSSEYWSQTNFESWLHHLLTNYRQLLSLSMHQLLHL